MTRQELEDEMARELAEIDDAIHLGGTQRLIQVWELSDSIECYLEITYAWDSRLPVWRVGIGVSLSRDADPRSAAHEVVFALMDLWYRSDSVTRVFRRKATPMFA